MRILYAGTPEIAVSALEALNTNFEIVGVLTNPDREKGRKKILQPSEVKIKALELGLNILQPEKLNSDFNEVIKRLKPDLLVCFAYGKLFRKEFLQIFPMGGINIHPSLLPIYRGASPITEAILNGDKESGISIQRLASKMDSGNILLQEKFVLDESFTTETLSKFVSGKVPDLITRVVNELESGTSSEWEQDDSKATFCTLIKKEDGVINWNNPSKTILNSIRAFSPWPLAHTMFNDKVLNIIKAEINNEGEVSGQPGLVLNYSKSHGYLVKTGDGSIYIKELQLQSKKVLDYKSFNNGVQNFVGTLLG